MMRIKVYDTKGRERYLSINDKVPAGYYDENFNLINKEKTVSVKKVLEPQSGDCERYKEAKVLVLV